MSSGPWKTRRAFLKTAAIVGAASTLAHAMPNGEPENHDAPKTDSFELNELTIAQLQDGMKSGRFTARALTEKYLARIDAMDKHGAAVNSVIELNPDALAIADALDRERKAKGRR